MPATLTLKNIPDEIYVRLKDAAAVHRRSMNSEAIFCLESMLVQNKANATERLARARAIRAGLTRASFRTIDIKKLKRNGRA